MALEKLHSFLLYDREEDIFYYLGYQLRLTKSEHVILLHLAENTGCYISAEDIAVKRSITPSSVSVHISAINEKAVALGGRNIIECKRGCGYKLFANL